MTDVPETKPVLNNFSELWMRGEFSDPAHNIEKAEAQCQAGDDVKGCHNKYFEELNADLRKKYRNHIGPLADMVRNFDVVGAVEDSLVLHPRTKDEDHDLDLQTDGFGPSGLLFSGSAENGSEFFVEKGKLHLRSWIKASHQETIKVGSHAFGYDTRFVGAVDLDPITGRITEIDSPTGSSLNGSVRKFEYDKSGHLSAWGVYNGVSPAQYWVKDTHEKDKWNLYVDEKNPVLDYKIEVAVKAIGKSSGVWNGEMKLTRDGNFIQRKAGEQNKAGEQLTHVETINGVRYEY